MDENQIDFLLYSNLHDRRSFYKGSHASDELDIKKLHVKKLSEPVCFSFIVNTLKRNESGKMGHWLAFFIKVERDKIHLKFVDSYKMQYTFYGIHIKNYINRLRLLALENNVKFIFEEVPFRMQSLNTKTCGVYTIYSVLGLKNCKSNSLYNIFSSFDKKNWMNNDRQMIEFIVKIWPKNSCSDIFTKYNDVPFFPKKLFDRPGCLKKCTCQKNCCQKLRSLEYIRPNVKNIFS